MDAEKLITEKLATALMEASERHEIPLKDTRIIILLDDGKLRYFISNKINPVCESKIDDIISLNIIEKPIVKIKLGSIMKGLQKELPEGAVTNARIYAIDSKGTPNAYLYNDNIPVRKVQMSDFT